MRVCVEERPFIKTVKVKRLVGGSSNMRVCVEERPFIKTVKVKRLVGGSSDKKKFLKLIGRSVGRRTREISHR